MVTTTGDGDDETPEPDEENNNASGRNDGRSSSLTADLVSVALMSSPILGSLLHDETFAKLNERLRAMWSPRVRQQVGRDQIVNVNVGTGNTTVNRPDSLAERRQEFHFDVLKLKMKHAQWMIFISVFAVAVGVVALIAGVAMALTNTGSTHGYVTGASGLAASLGGGALHRHAKRAMADLTDAAKRNEDKIDVDHQIEVATTLIDRVGDKGLKDRLNSAAALKALNIHPNPDTMFNNLLPGDPPKEIEPGAPTN